MSNWLEAREDVHQIDCNGDIVRFVHDGTIETDADLLREMVQAGFRIASFGSQAKTLEDVFMQVTEGLVQ